MDDIKEILSAHQGKNKRDAAIQGRQNRPLPSVSEIPDLFFDEILPKFKLNRAEICLLMILYREVWCRPNLYEKYGIGPINSLTEISKSMEVSTDILLHSIQTLESFGFIETIRSGQYFVRKYFTQENDHKYGQSYDNFL